MPGEPQIQSLSYGRRQLFFYVLVLVFLIALPLLIFYTTGYRLDFTNDKSAIVTTGGLYVTTDNLDVAVYLNGELVRQPRLFRSAYYIQNIEAGQHQVVVQSSGLHAWIKELPVDPYIVTEAAAFNMPVQPHIRPITEYLDVAGAPVVFGAASSTPFASSTATTTVPLQVATSTATSSYERNEEHVYVKSLFSSSSTSTRSVFDRLLTEVGRFGFASTNTPPAAAATTSEVVEEGEMSLLPRDDELYARWQGTINTIPYYFCVVATSSEAVAERYGTHVAEQVAALQTATTASRAVEGDRLCRREIKLDRLREDVYYYDFFPDSQDLVLLLLESGLYVTEIDDRAWQNTQLVYPGDGASLQVAVENGAIYVHDRGHYFELITEIEPR